MMNRTDELESQVHRLTDAVSQLQARLLQLEVEKADRSDGSKRSTRRSFLRLGGAAALGAVGAAGLRATASSARARQASRCGPLAPAVCARMARTRGFRATRQTTLSKCATRVACCGSTTRLERGGALTRCGWTTPSRLLRTSRFAGWTRGLGPRRATAA